MTRINILERILPPLAMKPIDTASTRDVRVVKVTRWSSRFSKIRRDESVGHSERRAPSTYEGNKSYEGNSYYYLALSRTFGKILVRLNYHNSN